jgi:hypothetical protein
VNLVVKMNIVTLVVSVNSHFTDGQNALKVTPLSRP